MGLPMDDTEEYYESRIRRYKRLRDYYYKENRDMDELVGLLVSPSEYKALLMTLKSWIVKYRYRYEKGEKIYYDNFGNQ